MLVVDRENVLSISVTLRARVDLRACEVGGREQRGGEKREHSLRVGRQDIRLRLRP